MNIKNVNSKGKIVPTSDLKIGIDNRAFRYGDGIFESMRMRDGKMPLWAFHFDRLREGMKALRFDIPKEFNANFFLTEILKLTKNQKNMRIRLSVFRGDGGLYTPQTNVPSFLIEADIKEDNYYQKNTKGLKLDWYDEVPILSQTRLAGIKSANALPYVMAAVHRKTFSYDDCLIFNEKGNIAESISSNIFLWENGKLITPSLKTGCVAGVMRRAVIEIAHSLNIKVKEQIHLKPKHVFAADGIFLTNAVQGLRWVKQVEFTEYPYPEIMDNLLDGLNDFSCP